jgi:hypothetical protein
MAAKVPAAGVDLDGAVTINESSADVDFRVESNDSDHMFYINAGTNEALMQRSLSSDTTTSPDTVLKLATKYASTGANGGAGAGPRLEFEIPDDETNPITGAAIAGLKENGDDSSAEAALAFYISQNDTTLDEAMRIASTGRVTIGGTSTSGDTLFNLYSVSHAQNAMAHVNSSDTGTIHNLRCINASGTLVGGITNDGSNTTFATSSDYRLKENVDYTWDATTRLKQLKPARFNWIADDTNTLMDGFIAHEVSSIVPEAVRGAKDATRTEIDEDGDEQTFIEPQGIDQSKLVPLMVKTIQELEARIKTLEDA